MLASSADSHSPVGESNVIGTPVSSLHSSLVTSGDDQSTLLGQRSCQGFRSWLFGYVLVAQHCRTLITFFLLSSSNILCILLLCAYVFCLHT